MQPKQINILKNKMNLEAQKFECSTTQVSINRLSDEEVVIYVYTHVYVFIHTHTYIHTMKCYLATKKKEEILGTSLWSSG